MRLKANAHMALRIVMGAGVDTVELNGHAFDRRKMDRDQRRQLNKAIVGAFEIAQRKQKKGSHP